MAALQFVVEDDKLSGRLPERRVNSIRRYKKRLMKIISGGQTGVDRAALDVALKLGIECGGWCPIGRRDEFGRIPDRYPVRELSGGDFDDRTRQNVQDSEGTLIFYFEKMSGGTEFTFQCCRELKRPCATIDAAALSVPEARQKIRAFVGEHAFAVLNVAGPRESEWLTGHAFAVATLEAVLTGLIRSGAP